MCDTHVRWKQNIIRSKYLVSTILCRLHIQRVSSLADCNSLPAFRTYMIYLHVNLAYMYSYVYFSFAIYHKLAFIQLELSGCSPHHVVACVVRSHDVISLTKLHLTRSPCSGCTCSSTHTLFVGRFR